MRVMLLSSAVFAGFSVAICVYASAEAAAPSGPIISAAVRHALSPPLRNIPPVRQTAVRQDQEQEKDDPRPIPFPRGTHFVPDGALQRSTPAKIKTNDLLKFDGLGVGKYKFFPPANADRPDANGAAGATQYVQSVNASFAVFDKNTGALVLGPIDGLTLFSPLGGPCAAEINGDPIVQYDKLANRWVLSAIATTNDSSPYAHCVAVSQTSDATGAYNLYEFEESGLFLIDYDKMGVWPDAYYVTYNAFNPGALVCALDRNSMLSGLAATEQCFQLDSSDYLGVLPADVDGTTPPPEGAPNYLINFGVNSLNEWQFHVDWTNPGNTTLTGPVNIPVPAFTPTCGGALAACVPQKGGRELRAMGDRLMHRFAYRNFGDHESLVVNHTVVAGNTYGVRWYELRTPLTPTIYQSGTYAPDTSLYRWMGSIAMDKVGDIAVGYSASDSAVYPSIRYTGRTPKTPLGTLLGEKTVKGSKGPHGDNSWGDYTGLSVDPTDDCTFYYTNEYLKPNVNRFWNTEVNAFKFPGCK